MFKSNAYEFEQLYRPLYELYISLVWILCAIGSWFISTYTIIQSQSIATIQITICLFMAAIFFMKGYHIFLMQKRLLGSDLEFIQLKDFIKRVEKNIENDEFYLGKGFAWTPIQTQRCYELLKLDWSEISKYETMAEKVTKRLKTIKKEVKRNENIFLGLIKGISTPLLEKKDKGQKWIHGLSDNIKDISIPANWLNGHLLILGTTGSGKTRLADLLCTQCIMRGESLIIIDPKGDKEMLSNAKNAAETYRQFVLKTTGKDIGKNFYYFHPADPENSVRLNLLANSTRDTDIATRITNLIPSSTGGFDPFTAFGWLAINAIVQALLYIGKNPTIEEIKKHLLNSMENLCSESVEAFCLKADAEEKEEKGILSHSSFHELLQDSLATKKNVTSEMVTTVKTMIFDQYYKDVNGATNIATLVKLRNHPREHFSKMINNMLPLLDMLTTGTLGTMLSMKPGDDPNMQHDIITTMDIIDKKYVLYIGLDSLSDKIVGTSIGSLALSDIASAAGLIYNYRENKPPVNVFVDEASECVNDSFIQILNKGRGAGYRLMVATQTISDFIAALGSNAKEEMVLGNVNNIIALRTKNAVSQEFLSNDLPKTTIKTITHTQGLSALTTQPLLHGASQAEQLKETESALIQPQLFGLLADLEYFGIFAGGTIIKGKLPLIVAPKGKKIKKLEKSENETLILDIDKQDK